MLPILAPLLSIGVSLVDKLVSKTTGEKDVIKGTLSRLANEGNKEQLEAEVQKLSLLVESDKAQAAINVAVAQQGGLGWRDWLGYGGTVCIIYSTVGVSLLNFIITCVNPHLQTPMTFLATVDTATVGTLLTGMLGLAGVQRLAKDT
jgi:hypothetical protein